MTILSNRRDLLLAAVNCQGYLVVDLARLMPKEIDHASLYYLTGYSGEGVLIITAQASVLLADERYFEMAKGQVGDDLVVRPASGNYLSNIKEEVDRLRLQELSFTSHRITYSLYSRLREHLQIRLTPREDPVVKLRMTKDAIEIERIKEAVHISEACLEELVKDIRVGMTEKEIALRLDMLILRNGAERAFQAIVAAGENCFNQHHEPSDRQIKAGDFLLIDFGAKKNEYLADITRTFAVETATPRMEAIYETARVATQIGIDALRPGVPLREVWQKIRAHFDHSDFAADGQIAGHSIGIDVHEFPFLLPEEDFELTPGLVITMEPGIYILGYGGVRIEDDVLVTQNEPEVLTSFPKELTVIG